MDSKIRTALLQGAADGHLHGWKSSNARHTLCRKAVARVPEGKGYPLCKACLPRIAKWMGTSVANVLRIHRAPNGVLIPLPSEPKPESN